MAERDLYAELGLAKGASKDEIKKAYRKLARELHPDRNPNNPKAEERFKRVAFAADVLGDDRKRALFDEFGEVGLRDGFDANAARAMRGGARGRGGPGSFDEIFMGGQPGRGRRSGFGGTIEDLFSGGIDELFGRPGGGGGGGGFGGRASTGGVKAPDQESEIHIDFGEALRGVEKELILREEGRERTIRARIPAGVSDGGKLRLRGQGAHGPGMQAGDLVLVVRVADHPLFRREGNDIHLDVPVTVAEAWRGTSLKVPTPEGEVSIKIPARVQSGGKLRLKGKGIAKREGGQGDMFVHIRIRLPTGDDHTAIGAALDELDKHYTVSVRDAFSKGRAG